jgi:exodeoxyribonuclease-1
LSRVAASPTFYWHDYETFGADPARDRPAQFAGIRTDAQLNVIGEPLVIFCRPANDFLPQPAACLVTGITPQQAAQQGVPECEFITRIHAELALPGTCGVGYNSIRFDDEVTRYTLYRNFFDAYAREWQNGNSRWDVIDMARTAYALRPEGIHWPVREDGLPSFRLEELTAANGINHEGAHDALADVQATIALARLIREKQPRLYEHLVTHRDKQSAQAQLDVTSMKPVLHISGMFGAHQNNLSLIAPLAAHPRNGNEVICWDLRADPSHFIASPAEQVRELLYTRAEDLPDGVQRPGLKSVHINRCPVLLPAKMADADTAARAGLDGQVCRRNLRLLQDWRREHGAAASAKLEAIYTQQQRDTLSDPDLMLYSGGFFSGNDKRAMEAVRSASPQALAQTSFVFEDSRLDEMLFRYRARNYPETLSAQERALWEEYRFQRLTEPGAGASLCMESFQAEIEERLGDDTLTPAHRKLLLELVSYADDLLA